MTQSEKSFTLAIFAAFLLGASLVAIVMLIATAAPGPAGVAGAVKALASVFGLFAGIGCGIASYCTREK